MCARVHERKRKREAVNNFCPVPVRTSMNFQHINFFIVFVYRILFNHQVTFDLLLFHEIINGMKLNRFSDSLLLRGKNSHLRSRSTNTYIHVGLEFKRHTHSHTHPYTHTHIHIYIYIYIYIYIC